MKSPATRQQIRDALRLSDALERVAPHDPAVVALARLLCIAAVDDTEPVDAERLRAAVEAVSGLIAYYAQPDDLRVVRVGSSSRPGVVHRVTLAGSRAVACTCEDATRHPGERCRHMASAERRAGRAA